MSRARNISRHDKAPDSSGINLAPILYFVSVVSCALGGFMLLPVLIDLADRHDDYIPFLICAAGTIFVGSGVAIATHGRHLRISQNETLLLLPITWLVACLVCAMPFMLAETRMSLADAVFESVSGLTSTGSTVMSGLDNAPRGLLMWRFLIQWIGGFGVVTVAVLALPFLRIGGLQLFSLDLSPNSTKFVPRMTEVVGQIGLIYILLSIICAICYWIAGMNTFDAIGHAMAAVATGGFSSHDASLGYFDSAAIEWISVVFMALGAMPFGLYIVALYGRPEVLYRDQQVRLFLLIILIASLLFAAWRLATAETGLLEALRQGAFVTVSTITTTGFTGHDFSFWGAFPEMLALLLMLIGGCTGSTVGGIKVFRLHTMMQLLRAQIHRQIYPHGTFRITFNGETIPDAVRAGVATYIFIYLITLAGLALAVAATGLSFTESLGAAATALGNNGPGLGSIYGPCCSFREAPDITKWLMSFGMLAGRLEILMLIIPLSRAFWRA